MQNRSFGSVASFLYILQGAVYKRRPQLGGGGFVHYGLLVDKMRRRLQMWTSKPFVKKNLTFLETYGISTAQTRGGIRLPRQRG